MVKRSCGSCGGKGWLGRDFMCPDCEGTGEDTYTQPIQKSKRLSKGEEQKMARPQGNRRKQREQDDEENW